jgi:DTW domain-containing protein YfiP
VCADIPTLRIATEVVIFRHVAERFRSSNTGRLAALALDRCRLVDHGVAGEPAADDVVAGDGTWLVYPEGEPLPAPPAPVRRLVFLDATWPQARRMRQRLAGLRGVPAWRLPIAEVPEARLRESPGGGRVSTLEAVAAALRVVEGPAVADALERLFARVVERARRSGRRG